MTGSPGFIHLRVHAVYSLKEGALHVGALPGEDASHPYLPWLHLSNYFA
jgi:hypothetical protein